MANVNISERSADDAALIMQNPLLKDQMALGVKEKKREREWKTEREKGDARIESGSKITRKQREEKEEDYDKIGRAHV